MAYLVFAAGDEEMDRRELSDAVVIGRSPECAISIRDINLSRKHCQIVPTDEGWAIEDLQSKNGTFINGIRIERQELTDGLMIHLGKFRLTYHAGIFVPMPKKVRSKRPAEPMADASAGTVVGFTLDEPASLPESRQIRFPRPQPQPAEPAAYQNDFVHTMLTELVSSSWDSIYATASRPVKPAHLLPRPVIRAIHPKLIRPKRPEFPAALQADAPEAPKAMEPVLWPIESISIRKACPESGHHILPPAERWRQAFVRFVDRLTLRLIHRRRPSVIVTEPLTIIRNLREETPKRRAA